MTIECKLCNRFFEKQITNRHLKFSHNITTKEYKEKYGDLVSPDYRQQRSLMNSGENNPNFGNKWTLDKKKAVGEKLKGRIPHNKGKKLEGEKLEKLRHAVALRDQRRKDTGWISPSKGVAKSELQKRMISDSVKKYASEHKSLLQERAFKTIQTKLEKGKDLAFFRGKTHSIETREKISKIGKENGKLRQHITQQMWKEKIQSYGFKILNEISDHYLKLECGKCGHIFERTGQAFYDSKYDPENCNFCPVERYGSRPELEILDWLATVTTTEILYRNKSAIWPKEIDIYLPEFSLGIEYCGLFWHSVRHGIDSNYHQQKWQLAKNKNIRLIQIFEDEWLTKKDIVKSIVLSKLKITNKIYARNTEVKQITSKQANDFYQKNHILGKTRASTHLGLFYQNELVAAMCFSSSSMSRKNKGNWELDRYVSKLNTTVVGGMSKLFGFFVNSNLDVNEIISYSDLRYGNGDSYLKLGFELEKITVPNYFYFKTNLERIHRFALRKNSNDPKDRTEKDIRLEQGYNIIYDAGHAKYNWKRFQ
jgi:hypothetical protein